MSKVMFIYINSYRRKQRKVIDIDMPKFKEQIVPGFNGSISVEEQIMEYLDTIDKSDIMAKYDMYEIITYFPYKKKKKRMSEKESFFNFLNTQKVVYNLDEKTMADIVAYASASKTLFGHRKSNEQKIQEIADNLTIFAKVRDNMLNMIFEKFNLNTLKKHLKTFNYGTAT